MIRPRLKRTTSQVETPEGDLYLLRAAVGEDIRIEGPTERDRRLLTALDGQHTRDELDEEFGRAEVGDLLAQLDELCVLEDAADDDQIPAEVVARFDRQLRYFSDITEGPTPSQCQAKLEEARIAVLGVGGLGGWSALSLACIGIGEMLLVDFDRVDLTNLNRQVLYSEADIGRPKVEAAAERLGSFNARMRLEAVDKRLSSEAEVAAAIEGYDVVIDAVDWPAHEIEHWVNAACFDAGIPYIAMSHFPPFTRVGPFYVPGRTGCYFCQEISYRRSYPLFDLAIEQSRAKESPAGTLGPACGLIGNLIALDVMHYLTGLAEPATLGVSHSYDLRTLAVRLESVVPEDECPVCGQMQAARELQATAPELTGRRRAPETQERHAEITYDAMAPVYDDFTADNDFEGWLSDLLPHLERCGLSGNRLLDVGCGTGKSFIPMLKRGWSVAGCDISPAMLARARAKVGEAARLEVADMRELPRFGAFDLVWALDDAINYLLSTEELEAALSGMRDNLASGGLLVFDLNAHHTYRTAFAERHIVEDDGLRLIWSGRSSPEVEAGSICEAHLAVEGDVDGEAKAHVHRQRHFPEAEVLAVLRIVGLEILEIFGHGLDGVPTQPLDEAIHTKAIYIARQR